MDLVRIIEATPAFMTHRASGDTIAALLIVVAVMCLSYFGLEDGAFHAVTGFLLLVVLAVGQHGGGVPGMTRQLIGSLLVAAIIVAVTIAPAKLGPTSAAELDAREERQEERLEQQEELREETSEDR